MIMVLTHRGDGLYLAIWDVSHTWPAAMDMLVKAHTPNVAMPSRNPVGHHYRVAPPHNSGQVDSIIDLGLDPS